MGERTQFRHLRLGNRDARGSGRVAGSLKDHSVQRTEDGVVLALEAPQIAKGAEVGTIEGGDLGEDFAEEFGGGGVAESGDVEVFGIWAFGEGGAVEFGLAGGGASASRSE